MKLWIDPPEGWKYGFPLVYDDEVNGTVVDWLVKCGYPPELIAQPWFYIRSWHWDTTLDVSSDGS
jgi:hypothetical protein